MELYRVIRKNPLCLLSTNKFLDMYEPRPIIPPENPKRKTDADAIFISAPPIPSDIVNAVNKKIPAVNIDATNILGIAVSSIPINAVISIITDK